MAAKRNVVTGATGLLGSHIVEALVERGESVRAMVRPSSDTTFLDSLGVQTVEGDLRDAESLRLAIDGAAIVYHCAARVNDWGPWKQYREEVIDGTHSLMTACREAGVQRVLNVSSVSVYGYPRNPVEAITEEHPLGVNRFRLWDRYCTSKIQAEEIARPFGDLVTYVRPSWIYGLRDRVSLPRLVKSLRSGRVFGLLGKGDNYLNLIHAVDVADGAIRAANHPEAAGETYNLTGEPVLTQREFLNLITDAIGRPRLRRRVPYWLAYSGGFFSEAVGKLIRLKRPPHVTRHGILLMVRPVDFSTEKARTQLGWKTTIDTRQGLPDVLREFLKQDDESVPAPVPIG